MNEIKIALLGLGTVGCGVVKVLRSHGAEMSERAGCPLVLGRVADTDLTRPRDGIDLASLPLVPDAGQAIDDPSVQIVIELIGGLEPARTFILKALAAGKHVVTANKALLARHGVALATLAESSRVALNFEAAVAGGIPVIKTLREALAGNTVRRVYGILNGTCNYILTTMRKTGREFADVLAEAQKLGYAEADPSFDVGGFDTAHKLALLTSLAFGTRTSFESVYVEGIESITPADIEAAGELGYRIKLLGVALRTDSGIEQRVHPTMVPKHTAIAEVDGVSNCVAIDGDFVGDVMLIGPGAGAGPTASSVTSDLIDIARGHILPPFGAKAKSLKLYKKAQMRAHEGGYYIRLSVYDRTGAFAAIASRMADQGISIESIVQRRPRAELPGFDRPHKGSPAAVVMITHQTTEAAIRKALAAIERDGHVDQKPQMIRIEKL